MATWTEYDTTLADPPPAERRAVSALLYLADPRHGGHYPTDLLLDIERYWRGWAAREQHTPPTGLAAAAIGGYVLGKTDEGEAVFPPPPPAAGAGGLTFAAGWFGGFFTCLVIVVLGAALMSLRAL
jgi:hypothetical protein